MWMTEFEIKRSYREAKNRRNQIVILSELNNCTVEAIRAIVRPKYAQKLPHYMTPDEKARALEMLRSGMTIRAVADATGRSDPIISKLRRQMRNG
jgi:uncharacterized protein YerC